MEEDSLNIVRVQLYAIEGENKIMEIIKKDSGCQQSQEDRDEQTQNRRNLGKWNFSV
jgi:hypothetical protein